MKLACLILLLLPFNADAADFVIHARDGRVNVWMPDGKSRSLTLSHPYWNWEGHLTNGTIDQTDDGIAVHVMVDEAGPWWVKTDITQGGDGLLVSVSHSGGHFAESRWYSSYQAMRHDDSDVARFAVQLLERINDGNPILEDSTIRALVSGHPLYLTHRLNELIRQLDDSDSHIRLAAQRELSDESYLPVLAYLDRRFFTEEQSAAVSAIINWQVWDYPTDFVNGLWN